MPNPGKMLERFENKYGEFNKLVDDVCSTVPGTPENKLAERLLRRHSDLVWMVTGYHCAIKIREAPMKKVLALATKAADTAKQATLRHPEDFGLAAVALDAYNVKLQLEKLNTEEEAM